MSDNPETPNAGEGVAGALSTVNDVIGDLVTGIPAPVRRNAIRAFARLCTAAVEYPLAVIEGLTAERRAESQARTRLIKASSAQIAKRMQTDPEYVQAAAAKFAQKIIRERVNIDQISEIAVDDLKSNPSNIEVNDGPEVPPISEDWLNAFENEAAQMSSEQMRRLYGRILAGEIRRPSSYSIKTVKLMAQLDNHAAILFRKLCSLSVSLRSTQLNMIMDARVISMGYAASNSLQSYGLGFGQLNILQEYGLIISDYNSYGNYMMAVEREKAGIFPITYQNVHWKLIPKTPHRADQAFNVTGVSLSRSGTELLSIVDILPDEKYTSDLKNFFDEQGMQMTALE